MKVQLLTDSCLKVTVVDPNSYESTATTDSCCKATVVDPNSYESAATNLQLSEGYSC